MADPTPGFIEELTSLIVDHPMWIGDSGEPLDYLPEREARIHDFLSSAAGLFEHALAEVRRRTT